MRLGRHHPFRLASLVGLALLAGPPRAAGQPVFRTAVDLVTFGVTVVDREGKPVGDLRREDFEIVEAGAPQKIQYFACGDREGALPLRVGLLFDTSGSMEHDASFARSAAIKFLNTLPRAEDFTLVDFATEVREPQRLRILQLAEATGGQAFFPPSIKHLDESYGRILEELGARCTLGYQSTNRRADGAWREVSIRVVRADLKGARVRTRKGYYAPYRGGGQ